MPTRNVVLTEHQEAFVSKLISTGHFQNTSEIFNEALRLLENQNQQAQLAAIQVDVIEGLDQIDQGRLAEGSGEAAIERALSRAIKKRDKNI